jgi:hypothetical protein
MTRRFHLALLVERAHLPSPARGFRSDAPQALRIRAPFGWLTNRIIQDPVECGRLRLTTQKVVFPSSSTDRGRRHPAGAGRFRRNGAASVRTRGPEPVTRPRAAAWSIASTRPRRRSGGVGGGHGSASCAAARSCVVRAAGRPSLNYRGAKEPHHSNARPIATIP